MLEEPVCDLRFGRAEPIPGDVCGARAWGLARPYRLRLRARIDRRRGCRYVRARFVLGAEFGEAVFPAESADQPIAYIGGAAVSRR